MSVATSRPPTHLDEPLTAEEVVALQKACYPVELLSFPRAGVIHSLRRRGYADIVLGGLQITPKGLERLVHERDRRLTHPDAAQRQAGAGGGSLLGIGKGDDPLANGEASTTEASRRPAG